MQGEGRSSIWTILAAVGGLLAGVAAILALFIAKPETIRVLIPSQTLQQAAAGDRQGRGDEDAVAPPSSASAESPPVETSSGLDSPASFTEPVVQTPAPAAEPVAPMPSQALGRGLSVTLVGLAEDRSRYVATLRFENSNASDLGVAVLWRSTFQGEMALTDAAGGSCPFVANGEGWGTLSTERLEPAEWQAGEPDFRAVQANGRAQHTMFFNKRRCDTRIATSRNLAISGSFVVNEQGRRRAAPVFFENLSLRTIQ